MNSNEIQQNNYRYSAPTWVALTVTLRLMLISILGELLPPTQAQEAFTRITSGPVVSDAASSIASGWVDFDDDGDLDLFVGNPDGPNLLYQNDGRGEFTPLTEGQIANAGPGSFAASWVDMNNDGRLDLYIARNPGPSLLFVQQINGTFTKSTLPMSTISGAAWADYDGDGFVDLLSADNSAGMLWRNSGADSLSVVANKPINIPGVGVTTWADYDADGDIDVLATASAFRGGTITRLFRNEGRGVFTPITTGPLVQQNIPFTGASWGDYDNDGFLDVFLPRLVAGQVVACFLFHNSGNGGFTRVVESPVTTDTGASVGGSWADYDNDGWLDLFIADADGGSNRLYHNNGDGTFSRVLSGPVVSDGGTSQVGAWGDYDRDGFLDLFVSTTANSGPQPDNYLYHNDGNDNAWLTIKCVGTRSNRSAIGTKVRVKASIAGKTFWQLREINTGTGWAQNAIEAHFGLGNASAVETLRIEWPSGTVQEFQNVPAKQYLTVTEPSHLFFMTSNDPVQFTLQGGRNLQYDIETSTNLSEWSTLKTLTITNADGRVVVTDTNAPTSPDRFYRTVLR